MPDQAIEPRKHYVYALYREDGVTPFYIGMGQRDRWLQHERLSRRRRNHKDHIIANMLAAGLSIPKAKLRIALTKEAIAIEIGLIASIGRMPNGPLVNFTSGGEGILGLSPEKLAQRSAAVAAAQRRPEVNAKRSATQTGRKGPPCSDSAKAKLRAANLGKKMPEHVRTIALKNLEGARGRVRSPEEREKIRQSKTGFKHSPATIEKMRRSHAGFKHSPETIMRMRQRRKTPEEIEHR